MRGGGHMPSKKKRFSFTYNGKRYNIYASSAREAALRMAEKQKELEEGVRITGGSMSFRTWATQYLEVYKTSLKPDSYQSYVRVVNQLCKQIGDLPLKSIAPLDCQRAINAFSGKSKSYIRNLRRSLKEIMQCAVDNKKIKENPAESVVMPTGYRSTRRALTSEERERVLQLAVTNRRYYAYLLMMLCGCRPAEASEVKRSDISDVTGMDGQIYHLLHIRGTKTKNADRKVPMPDMLYDLLKDIPPDEYITPTLKGTKHGPWNQVFKKFAKKAGISEELRPYNLRHEFCTECARRGVDVRVAMKLMGHSTIAMTAEVYTNLQSQDILQSAAKLNDVHNKQEDVLPPVLPKAEAVGNA